MAESGTNAQEPAPSSSDAPAARTEGPGGAPAAPRSGEPPARGGGRDTRGGGGRGGERTFGGRDLRGRGGREPRGRGPKDRRGGAAGEDESRFEERVVKINKCSTVVKGGRRFSFSALAVVGDREGMVGVGFGKANEVPPTVEKAMKEARRNLQKVSLKGSTIPHKAIGNHLSTKVVLVPAAEGTGVIAGAAVRAVVECAGIKDVLTKVYGSTNPINVVKATLSGLKSLRSREEIARLRGVEV